MLLALANEAPAFKPTIKVVTELAIKETTKDVAKDAAKPTTEDVA